MKNILFAVLLLLTACNSSKKTTTDQRGDASDPVRFSLRNNSLMPHKYAVIGYEPGMTGNWTMICTLTPGAQKKFKCPVGTKIYLADDQQVSTVMGGGNIRNDVPLLIVKAEDNGQVFKLNRP